MINPDTHLIELLTSEYIKYSKQLILKNISIEGQKRIKNSKILIIGVGGLGNPIAIYLAASGIGYIGLLDPDKIELTNLNRQIIYQEKDINKLKVILAKTKINEINKNCKIILHSYKLNNKNSQEILTHYDIIIDTTDNFDTRYIIDETCSKLHKTYIYGAVDEFIGQVGIMNYKDGIKYINLYPKHLNLKAQNCNIHGVMGISTGYIGILQAIETIKIIIGNKNKLNNSILICNLIETAIKVKTIHVQQEIYNQNEINENNLRKKLQKTKNTNNIEVKQQKQLIIIDIRNNKEFIKKHINKSINIPFSAFKLYKTLYFLKKNHNKKDIYVYCETSHKSFIVSSILNNNKITNLIIKNNETDNFL